MISIDLCLVALIASMCTAFIFTDSTGLGWFALLTVVLWLYDKIESRSQNRRW